MAKHRIFTTPFATVYPLYVAKAEKKGRTQEEVNTIVLWLTGYTPKQLSASLDDQRTFEEFFAQAPCMNPLREFVNGVVCGVRVENVEDPLMREIRILDKLIDELAKGKTMEKILRKAPLG
jgi:hypothetical protein